MSEFHTSLKYTPFHQWVSIENCLVRVGVTDFAQAQLGDVVFVELPNVDQVVIINESCATIESVKAASDILSPISGKVTAVNLSIIDLPEQINELPYESWLFCIEASDLSETEQLLSYDDYTNLINNS